jgi:rubrerythrin
MSADEAKRAILQGLWEAIELERNGYQFYRAAADRIRDPDGVKMFTQLADDEVEHERILMERYKSVEATGEFPDTQIEVTGETADRIFSDEFVERLTDAHFEMSALGIGMTLEHATMELYNKNAVEATSPEVGQFWQSLATWEQGHYNVLKAEHDRLKQHYWTENRFWPF